jgi:hypothetical protein
MADGALKEGTATKSCPDGFLSLALRACMESLSIQPAPHPSPQRKQGKAGRLCIPYGTLLGRNSFQCQSPSPSPGSICVLVVVAK